MEIGTKILINGGKDSKGNTRLVVYLPKSVISHLKLLPGDEVIIGKIEKTGKNKLKKRGSNFNGIQRNSKSTASETERSSKERISQPDSTETL